MRRWRGKRRDESPGLYDGSNRTCGQMLQLQPCRGRELLVTCRRQVGGVVKDSSRGGYDWAATLEAAC